MNISPNELRRMTVSVLNDVDKQITEIKQSAGARGVPSEKMRDENGGYILSPLLLAKAQCLGVLVQLQEQGKKR